MTNQEKSLLQSNLHQHFEALEAVIGSITRLSGCLFLYPSLQPNQYLSLSTTSHEGKRTFVGLLHSHVVEMNASFSSLFKDNGMLNCHLATASRVTPIRRVELTSVLMNHIRARYLLFSYAPLTILKQAVDDVLHYSKIRTSKGIPIHRHQLVQDAIAQGITGYVSNQLWLQDYMSRDNISDNRLVSELRMGIEASIEAMDTLTPVMGAYGLTSDASLGRYTSLLYNWRLAIGELSDIPEDNDNAW